MFGYVRPLKPELKVKDFEVFRGMYCGLCHTLADRYGAGTENLLNYDLCFLAILISQANGCEITQSKRHCISSPLKGKICAAQNEALTYAADATVILSYHKILDGINDENGAKKVAYQAAKAFYKPKYKKAREYLPRFDLAVRENLQNLTALENENCSSIDRTADTFANILGSLADAVEENSLKRIVKEILYHVGRWIYILDAWDDFDEDLHDNKYNPIYARYYPLEDKQSVKNEISATLSRSLETAAACAQLLPEGRFMPVINNILYEGLPSVTEQVLEGRYKKGKFLRGRSNNGSL